MTRTTGALDVAIRRALEGRVSVERLMHCEGVATLAVELCRRFGEPEDGGRLAGLGHDIAREMGADEMRCTAARDGGAFDDDERDTPVLVHGRAGAVLLREIGVEDRAVLDAVRDHVTGRAGMGALSCIIFVADYLEPRRGFLAEPERLAVLGTDLPEMVRFVLDETVRHLERSRRPVARAARELDRWLRQERSYGG